MSNVSQLTFNQLEQKMKNLPEVSLDIGIHTPSINMSQGSDRPMTFISASDLRMGGRSSLN